MNRWKTAFWICFVLLIAVTLVGLYSIIDQGVTITYQQEGYSDTESDLDELIHIINTTDLSKDQIMRHLEKEDSIELFLIKDDTIYMNRIGLIFTDNRLQKISKQW